jgi:hypothetical protein
MCESVSISPQYLAGAMGSDLEESNAMSSKSQVPCVRSDQAEHFESGGDILMKVPDLF